MSRRSGLSLVALCAGAALVAVAFTGPVRGGGAAEARKGGTLRMAGPSDVDYVDPALAYRSWSWPIGFATCAKLFNYPDEAGAAGTRVIPEVAAGFPRVSNDGRTYTFALKRTFRFHTGAPVTASSFAAAFDRDADPRLKSWAVPYMREIVGADAVIAGRAKTFSGIRVLDRYRLQIRLRKPVGDFIARLAMPVFCPILPNTPTGPAGTDKPPGSGPYYVAEWIVNRRVVLRRSPYYRGGRPASVDEVVYTPGITPETCLSAVEEDEIDHCATFGGIPAAAYRPLAEKYGINRPGGRFFVNPRLVTWYFAFNHDRPAFKGQGQIPLKRAINYALDRPALARGFGYLGGTRTDQMLPPSLGRDESLYPLKGADPATARKWFAKARFKPTKLVLYTNNGPVGVATAEVFAFDLKQIGIDVEVKYFDFAVLQTKAGTRGEPFDAVLNPWAVDYADPASFFEPLLNVESLRSPGHWNFSYFDDPRVNARIASANRLTGEARRRAWADLDADLMRTDPPWAPFMHPTGRNFVSASFGCFLFHPVLGVNIAAACKK